MSLHLAWAKYGGKTLCTINTVRKGKKKCAMKKTRKLDDWRSKQGTRKKGMKNRKKLKMHGEKK